METRKESVPTAGSAGAENAEATGDRAPLGLRTLLGLAALVFLSRLPFLGPGYGWDSDAWILANTARRIAATHEYQVSRFPGFPVVELAAAGLIGAGPMALLAATAAFSAVAAALFAVLLRRLGLRDALLGGAALAFVPVVYISSTEAMDYVWALAFMLAAFLLVVQERPVWAGICLGLAIGSRLTSAAALVPLALWIVEQAPPERRMRQLLPFLAVSLLAGALAFAPVPLKYGLRFLSVWEFGYPPVRTVIENAIVGVWGLVGALAVGAALVWRLLPPGWAAAGRPALPRGGALAVAGWVASILAWVAVYVRLPHEPAYLLPALPFALLLLARWLPPVAFRAVAIALLLAPFVGGMPRPRERPRPETVEQPALLDLARGPIFQRYDARMWAIQIVDRAVLLSAQLPRPSVVVTESWLPLFETYVPSLRFGNATYVYLLDPRQLAELRARGVDLYYLPFAREHTLRRFGVDLVDFGARPLGW